MSKRGAGERDGYAASQGNMRKARVEVRRVDAIQVLMAAARSRSSQPAPQPQQQQAGQPAAAAAAGAAQAAALPAGAAPAPPGAVMASAPCTHCGTVLPVSAGSLRQCCACLDVFCSLCSVLDYEEREDRVFCLSCLEEQTAAARGNRGVPATPGGPGSRGAATGGLSLSLSLPLGSAGRWGALDALGGDPTARSPFPCSRTPGTAQPGSRTPGSALYSSRSHRGFSALLAYGGGGGV